MSNPSNQFRTLSAFALTALIAASGCALDADTEDVAEVKSGVDAELAEYDAADEFQKTKDLKTEHKSNQEADSFEVKVVGDDDVKKAVRQPVSHVPNPTNPEDVSPPLHLSAAYLANVANTLNFVTPTSGREINQDSFLGFDLGGTLSAGVVNTSDEVAISLYTYSYNADARLFELVFNAEDGSNKGSMTCKVTADAASGNHVRGFDCFFSVQQADGERSGSIILSHSVKADTMRLSVESGDMNAEGGRIMASLHVQEASNACQVITSRHSVRFGNGDQYNANMSEVVRCELQCQPKSGMIEMAIHEVNGTDQNFTLMPAAGADWKLINESSGNEINITACQ